MTDLPPLWPPQSRAITLTHEAIAAGERGIVLCLPTGGGKSRVACELINDWLTAGLKVSLYTNRRMLLDQLSGVLSNFGLKHGLRTADAISHKELPNDFPLQVSSIQTEASRTLKKKTWQIHPAQRVIIDECHLQTAAVAQELFKRHLEQGAAIVGLTATPIGLAHLYDKLIVAGTNADLRACGALVPAIHYGPDEPDTSKVKKAIFEYSENDVRKVMNVQHIFGRILEWFRKLNPRSLPSILFAPGVPESIWLCEQFSKAGIPAAHIDGTSCVYQGETYDSHRDRRREILRASRAGEVVVLCNRFVLREGIDAPWLAHGIFATVFSTLQSYLQSGGRLLRSFPGLDAVTIQDHGGNWWRHGSLNADRDWSLDDTENALQGLREEGFKKPKAQKNPEPCRCPSCARVLMGMRCPCGFEIKKKTRPVIQEDGSIKEHTGEIFRPRWTQMHPNTAKLWEQMYWRFLKCGKTFSSARGLFFRQFGYFPPPDLPLMPKRDQDWFRSVATVPREDLR